MGCGSKQNRNEIVKIETERNRKCWGEEEEEEKKNQK